MKSKLTLVGAGPGDPELITLKGIKAIESADVVLYDALANDQLLEYSKPGALKVYVGKRGGKSSFDQNKINQLIISYASVFGHVVRLKGGDPFVFGRGKEEIDFAKKHGLDIDIVPGISSSTGLTATQGISLTERGVADGFWVLTASLKENKFNPDLRIAAQSKSTVVVLMGVKHIQRIAAEFKLQGKEGLSVLIIQNGSTIDEKVLRTDVRNMHHDAKISGIQAPAVIILGDVARTSTVKNIQPLLTTLN